MAGDHGCSAEAFRSDLTACTALAAERGLTLRSFVYPRNSIGHVDVLADAGFTNYRGKPRPPFTGHGRAARTALRVVDRVRPLAGSAVRPEPDEHRVWNIPQTFLFAPGHPSRRGSRSGCGPGRPSAGSIRPPASVRCSTSGSTPTTSPPTPERAFAAFERVCAEAARLRSRDRLDVLSMGELAERLTQTGGEMWTRSTSPPPAHTPQFDT